jgi:hypothetical protein
MPILIGTTRDRPRIVVLRAAFIGVAVAVAFLVLESWR